MSSPNKTLCILASIAALAFTAVSRAELKVGDAFPQMAAADFSGSVPPSQGKVTLVDFWASWCAPCKASFPVYSKIQQDFSAKGLVIIAVSVDEDPASYASFIDKHKPLFPTVHDAEHRLVAEVDVPTMPTSYLIDRSGKVRFVHVGFHGDSTDRALRTEIAALLDEKAAP